MSEQDKSLQARSVKSMQPGTLLLRSLTFGVALACTGCATTLGYLPAYPRPGGDGKYLHLLPIRSAQWGETPTYESVHSWAFDVMDAYGSRATLNRHIDSAGASLAVTSAAAMVGLATLGSGTSPWIKGLPIGTSFAAGIMTVYANEAKAEVYSAAANYVQRAINNSDRRYASLALGACSAKTDVDARLAELKDDIAGTTAALAAVNAQINAQLKLATTDAVPVQAPLAADVTPAPPLELKKEGDKSGQAKTEQKAKDKQAKDKTNTNIQDASEDNSAPTAKTMANAVQEAKLQQVKLAQDAANLSRQTANRYETQLAALNQQNATLAALKKRLAEKDGLIAAAGNGGCPDTGTDIPSPPAPKGNNPETQLKTFESLCLRDDIMDVKERVDKLVEDLTPANISDSLKGVGSISGKKNADWVPTNVIDHAQQELEFLQSPIVSKCGVF